MKDSAQREANSVVATARRDAGSIIDAAQANAASALNEAAKFRKESEGYIEQASQAQRELAKLNAQIEEAKATIKKMLGA